MNTVKLFTTGLLLVLCGAAWAVPELAGKSPEDAGTEIAEYAQTYHSGWKSSKSEGRMVLRDAQGTENTQKLKTWLLESEGDKDGGRSFIVYDEKGTALLTHMHKRKSDVQWVWIPGLKRKMRVKAANVTGAFIGSEFAIEDLRSQYPEKFQIRLLGEETVGDQLCWKLERIPRVSETGYSKHIVWIDQSEFRVLKTDFYDKKGDLLKTMTTHDWQQHNNTFWRSHLTSMKNHQTGRSSDMLMDEGELGIRLKKSSCEAGRGLMREAK